MKSDPKKIFQDVLQHVELMKENGVDIFDIYQEDIPFTINPERGEFQNLDSPQIRPNLPDQKIQKLMALQELTKNCQKCSLFYTRNYVVFGRGDAHASLLFIGGYPSEIDDMSNMLFNGKEGDLFNKMIEAMQIDLSEVFITTAVKCHPPGQKQPNSEQIEACVPYLRSQIEIINPSIIVTLGEIPYMALMKSKPKLFSQREHWESYQGIPLLSTFDIDQMLKNPEIKKDVWADLKGVLKKYQDIQSEKQII